MYKSTKHFIELLQELSAKELKAKYKSTSLGLLWMLVNPLLQMIVIGSIFKFLINSPVKNYFPFLFIGLLIWNFFTMSLSKATPSMINERSLIDKAKFPYSVIPLSIIISNFMHFFFALFLFTALMILGGSISISRLPLVVIGSLLLISFTSGICLCTSALNVRYRDINFIVQALLIVWFYATPIVYSVDMVPESIRWLWQLNPLTAIIQLFQYALTNSSQPNPEILLSNGILILLAIVAGISIFHSQSKYFVDFI